MKLLYKHLLEDNLKEVVGEAEEVDQVKVVEEAEAIHLIQALAIVIALVTIEALTIQERMGRMGITVQDTPAEELQ